MDGIELAVYVVQWGHGDGPSGPLNVEEFRDQLNSYQLLNKSTSI
jgi:hypothetical protein